MSADTIVIPFASDPDFCAVDCPPAPIKACMVYSNFIPNVAGGSRVLINPMTEAHTTNNVASQTAISQRCIAARVFNARRSTLTYGWTGLPRFADIVECVGNEQIQHLFGKPAMPQNPRNADKLQTVAFGSTLSNAKITSQALRMWASPFVL